MTTYPSTPADYEEFRRVMDTTPPSRPRRTPDVEVWIMATLDDGDRDVCVSFSYRPEEPATRDEPAVPDSLEFIDAMDASGEIVTLRPDDMDEATACARRELDVAASNGD